MGASPSVTSAQTFCPHCFDLGWTIESKELNATWLNQRHYRPKTLDAWIKHWELECLDSLLITFGIDSLEDCLKLTQAHHKHFKDLLNDKVISDQWSNGIKHLVHLEQLSESLRNITPVSLRVWLECWRLHRLAGSLEAQLPALKEDILELNESMIQQMRPLEVRRWKNALKVLREGPQAYTTTHVSCPTLKTWLDCYHLSSKFHDFVEAGVDDVRDVVRLQPSLLQKYGFSDLDLKQWDQAVHALSTGEANPSFSFSDRPECSMSLQEWLQRYHLSHLAPQLEAIGVVSPIDLLDLTPQDMHGLILKPLELKRWQRSIDDLDKCPPTPPCQAVLPIDKESKLPTSDPLDQAKKVVLKTKWFKHQLHLGSWDMDLLDYILNEIAEAVSSHLPVPLLVKLLDCLQDQEKLESQITEVRREGSMSKSQNKLKRIVSSLRLLKKLEKPSSKFSPSLSSPKSTETSKGCVKKERDADTLTALTAQNAVELYKPTEYQAVKEDDIYEFSQRALPTELDQRVLNKLKYRWMATSLTLQGESARVDWVSKFKPPHVTYDTWLTLEGVTELVRHVLQITSYEISNFELELFFNMLDKEGSGCISFYKFVGLLEADNVPSRPMRKIWKRRKNRKKKTQYQPPYLEQPPWVPPVIQKKRLEKDPNGLEDEGMFT